MRADRPARAGPGDTERFFVGDEFQSIYGFRHADVQVFRERRDAAPAVLALTRNYRSRPEVLAVGQPPLRRRVRRRVPAAGGVGRVPRPGLRPPGRAARDRQGGVRGHRRRTGAAPRRGTSPGGSASSSTRATRAPGEIVLLFAAGTDAEWYEEELRALGLPTYRATGRGYFGQQQVVDLLAYLRLLHNRYDDEALVTVLASPFVGVSNDALVLIRRAAPKRPLFTGARARAARRSSTRDDARLLRAFRQRYDRLVAASARLSLERLCERIVAEHDYDLAVLAQLGRPPPLRQPAQARAARALVRGAARPRHRGLRPLRPRPGGASARASCEAVAEEEGADAVRLLTIHAAKGLEFKVVVVADAGRDRRPPSADEILALSDGRFGFRIVDPATGKRRAAFAYDEVRSAGQAEEQAERLRLYYVAMTRAIDRLIVSGAVDPSEAGRHDADRLGARAARRRRASSRGRRARSSCERDGARVLVRVDRARGRGSRRPEPARSPRPGSWRSSRRSPAAPLPPPAPALPALEPLPAPPLHVSARLSFTALALFERCSYRYYAERVAGHAAARTRGDRRSRRRRARRDARSATPSTGLLELVDLARAGRARRLERACARGTRPSSDEELARIAAFVAAYCASPLARGSPRSPARGRERPFAFEHDGVLFHGCLDVAPPRRRGARWSSTTRRTRSPRRTPAEIVEADYRLQRLVYALACLRAGADEVEVVYQFLERPDERSSRRRSRAADVPALEAELSAAIARIARRRVPADAERVHLRGLPCARRRLRRARALGGAARRPRPRWRRSRDPCASPRSTTSTATCPRSRRCSPSVRARAASTRSSAAATDRRSGPLPVEMSRPAAAIGDGALFIRGNADALRRRAPRGARPGTWSSGSRAAARTSPRTSSRPAAGRARCRRARTDVLYCHGSPRERRRDPDAVTPDERCRARSQASRSASSSVATRTSSSSGRARRHPLRQRGQRRHALRGSPGAFWALLDGGVELRRRRTPSTRRGERIRGDRRTRDAAEMARERCSSRREPRSSSSSSSHFESRRRGA